MSFGITREDVIEVASSINKTLTDGQIIEVLSLYDNEEENDPTATFDIIIENCIYQVINL